MSSDCLNNLRDYGTSKTKHIVNALHYVKRQPASSFFRVSAMVYHCKVNYFIRKEIGTWAKVVLVPNLGIEWSLVILKYAPLRVDGNNRFKIKLAEY